MTDPIKAKIQELVPDLNGDSVATLAVVLRAIEKGNPSALTNVHVELNGNICVRKSGQETFHIEAYWNLEQDNYDQQSDETKQFIGQLLNVV